MKVKIALVKEVLICGVTHKVGRVFDSIEKEGNFYIEFGLGNWFMLNPGEVVILDFN